MNESYDPGTHLLVVALIVFYWQLVRIWTQLPPPDGDGKTSGKQAPAGGAPKLAPAALRQAQPSSPGAALPADPTQAVSTGDPLTVIRAADGHFDEKAFLAGAALAYELVVNAYAEEDEETLEELLDPRAYHDFMDAIAARRARGERLGFTFIGVGDMQIIEASSEADLAEITVRFASEAVVAVYAADGRVVDGDAERIVGIVDEWTFARRLGARDPNWKLVAT